MKKVFIALGAIVAIVGLFFLSRCDFWKSKPVPTKMATIVYSDYSIYDDGREVLMVVIPSMTGDNADIKTCGGAVLPVKEAVNSVGKQVELKRGNLIVMEFDQKLIIGQNNNIKAFVNAPSKTTLLGEGFSFIKREDRFYLSIPISDFGFDQSGGTLNFYSSWEDKKPIYSTIIEDFSNYKLTFEVKGDMVNSVINAIAFGRVEKINLT